MAWSQHGRFALQWQGDVLMARYEGSWNEVAAQNLHRQARELWQQRGPKPWGLLSDALDWEGATPEALQAWWLFFEDAAGHGMVAATDILPSGLHGAMVRDLALRAASLVSYQASESVEAGLRWLAGQGLASQAD